MIIHLLIKEEFFCVYSQVFRINVKQKYEGRDKKTANKETKSFMFCMIMVNKFIPC